jgi:hypothetical protein
MPAQSRAVKHLIDPRTGGRPAGTGVDGGRHRRPARLLSGDRETGADPGRDRPAGRWWLVMATGDSTRRRRHIVCGPFIVPPPNRNSRLGRVACTGAPGKWGRLVPPVQAAPNGAPRAAWRGTGRAHYGSDRTDVRAPCIDCRAPVTLDGRPGDGTCPSCGLEPLPDRGRYAPVARSTGQAARWFRLGPSSPGRGSVPR